MSNKQAKYEMTKDELFELKISSYNQEEYEKSKRIWDNFAKPLDGFGDFEEVVSKINAIQGLDIEKRAAVIFCADNGVVEEGVTQCKSRRRHKYSLCSWKECVSRYNPGRYRNTWNCQDRGGTGQKDC